MFGEYMKYEQFCEVSRGDGVMGRNEYCLFHEAVYHYQDCSVPDDFSSCSMRSINIEFQGCSGIGSCLSKP